MTENADELFDKIRNAINEIRESGATPNVIAVPAAVYGDLAPLIPMAAERFGIAEDRVTFNMLLAIYSTLPE